MRKLGFTYTIPFLCCMLNVSLSGYYAWSSRLLSQDAQDEVELEIEIQKAHRRNREVAGHKTIQRGPAVHGITMGICMIRKIRKKPGIQCKQRKKFRTTTEDRLSYAAHKDLFNGEIVGYALGSRITKELIIARKGLLSGLINHSDRGSQYCSAEYRKLLVLFNMKQSMNRKGDCYDNAPMESFWER